MGVVPNPAPVPLYMTHSPQAALSANWASFRAKVRAVPLVHGRLLVLAKFSLKLHVPWLSWPAP